MLKPAAARPADGPSTQDAEFSRGGRLTAAERHALPKGDFALPGGHYPISDENHARNALARGAQFASPTELARIKRKVKEKFPSIDVS